MPPRVPTKTKIHYLNLRKQGFSMKEAANEVGVSYGWAKANDMGLRNSSGDAWLEVAAEAADHDPIPLADLGAEAKRSLEDIAFFAQRYFGLILMPWQTEATGRIVELAETDDEEYVVINAPPGTGKSTFFTLVLPAWMTCRERTIRGMIGSASTTTANWYTGRLRDAFTRRDPVRAKPRELRLGLAVDAEATLLGDFGRFKPDADGDIWRADRFKVAQQGGIPTSEKEPTWMAFGQGSTFLGARVDLCIWDDVYDDAKMATAEAREKLKRWWSNTAETRIEPGGLLVLQGQRMDADDIYRYAIEQPAEDPEGEADTDDLDVESEGDRPRKYHHFVYKAHYEENCAGVHHRDDPPWPEGCLVYPRRLTHRRLGLVRKADEQNGTATYAVTYQQEDVNPANVLVDELWVKGGRDPDTGEIFPGCWDDERGVAEVPKGLRRPLVSYATADPSAAKWWAIQWWLYHPATGQRFLLDLIRRKMRAPDFLEWHHNTTSFSGVMQDWQVRSKKLGVPITAWVVEQNAAQRYLLQYEHTQRWMGLHHVRVFGHDTNRNKADPDLGVWARLRPVWRTGLVRLPGANRNNSRLASLKLTAEVTRWPNGATDDCVMAQWFGEHNLRLLGSTAQDKQPKNWRPNWMKGGEAA